MWHPRLKYISLYFPFYSNEEKYARRFIIGTPCISRRSTLIAHILFRKVKIALLRYLAHSTFAKISTLLPDIRVYIPPLTILLNSITTRYWHENELRYAECFPFFLSHCLVFLEKLRLISQYEFLYPCALVYSSSCR